MDKIPVSKRQEVTVWVEKDNKQLLGHHSKTYFSLVSFFTNLTVHSSVADPVNIFWFRIRIRRLVFKIQIWIRIRRSGFENFVLDPDLDPVFSRILIRIRVTQKDRLDPDRQNWFIWSDSFLKGSLKSTWSIYTTVNGIVDSNQIRMMLILQSSVADMVHYYCSQRGFQ